MDKYFKDIGNPIRQGVCPAVFFGRSFGCSLLLNLRFFHQVVHNGKHCIVQKVRIFFLRGCFCRNLEYDVVEWRLMWMLTFGIVIAGTAAVLLAAVFARVNGYSSPQGKLLSKGLASLAFVALGLLCAAKAGGSAYAVLAVLALAAGAAGDTLLQLSECRRDWRDGLFMAGLIAFLLGHVLYIAAFMTAVRTTFWQFGAAAVMFAVLYALQFPAKIRLGNMKGPVYAYAAVITLMAAYAFSCATHGSAAMAALVVPAGAMFLVSDAVLAEMLYGPKRTGRMEILNLVTYYGAQILLAFSILTA